MISADGEISRRIPVSAEIEGVLKELDEVFSAIFGRRHLPADPVFPLKYLYSQRDLERETIDVMRRAGARPELVYAYRKTGGLLVTEANVDELPTQDRADWENAIDEYFETGGQEPVSEQDAAWIDLADELKHLIIVFGYLLEYGISESYQPNSEPCGLLSKEQYCLICASRSFKTLRSIHYLLEKDIGADALALARNLYESYLHIVFVQAKPEKLADLVDASLGLRLGTHEYAVGRNGRSDRRVIIEKATGRKFEGFISKHRMAASSPVSVDVAMFDGLYEFLSEFNHPGFPLSQLQASDDALDPVSTELHHESLLYSVFFAVLLLDQLRLLPMLTDQMTDDLAVVVCRIRDKQLEIIDNFIDSERSEGAINLIGTRLRCIGDPRA